MIRSFITRTDLLRVALGWGAVVALLALHPLLAPPVPGPLLVVALLAIVAVILVCAFGVVKQAEALAHRLGDPYGSLVLTLSIVLIEVILISAVMLGPGEHATIARDSVMAVSMIILNLVIGLALLLGGLRHRGMAHNRTGTSAYLSMLVVLVALAFGLPGLIGDGGAYTVGQEIPIIVLTLVLYAFFLFRQMGAQADDFTEVDERLRPAHTAANAAPRTPIRAVLAAHRVEVLTRLVLLVITVVPIVLLSHDMAALLDDGLGRLGAPVALAGLLIAGIVFLPESITSIRAALNGEAQRVNNLCHGALVSTVGLTIPAVLLIGMLTGQQVVLAESPANLLMLAVTLLLSVTTFAAKRVTAMHGAAHLATFAVYVLILFS
ncbi:MULTISPECIES: calcium:proton antiporter [unclassified Microbacterium]|uniref:calcium:proton antiporter n=1 Tax=unclassified Microbacterium TaxID=2609290 RepID=UPI0024691CD3|nr:MULTISPECIES: calcium:proton antiporter [unclassified Microbacterium]MDH5132903.1 calcium:proton antiporter [Microbacterium sp. RD10]MDH5136025.1 calcium:proton antiporter [Microbacterium sp. RD11]MDH5146082.1 calcium:proton antiporter [Microbacterium sp. RD12]MDH5154429.1 calcium:proton antiporter [Microbacterium sp. RD06]MDH5167311.1 calcium:proton antiporter [Microbacterium sp. RD02]